MEELISIQKNLDAPKNQLNKFGGYKYRSCEDILAAAKPLLTKHKCTLTLSDEVVRIGERTYVKATATLENPEGAKVSTTAYAREEETKKGMDAAQITGSASSYARKYALNGLFCIDDNKDSDGTERTALDVEAAKQQLEHCATLEELQALWQQLVKANSDIGVGNNPLYIACVKAANKLKQKENETAAAK